jgi:hypothetical protein
MGRSRTFTRRRPWPTALVPHELHPTTSAVVSTYSHSSPSSSIWAPTTNPGMPSNAVAPSLRCFTVKGLLFCSLPTAAEWRGPWPRWWIYGRGSGLTPPHASSRRAAYPASPDDDVPAVPAGDAGTTRALAALLKLTPFLDLMSGPGRPPVTDSEFGCASHSTSFYEWWSSGYLSASSGRSLGRRWLPCPTCGEPVIFAYRDSAVTRSPWV